MISNPLAGDRVQLWYATKPRPGAKISPSEFYPHHGKIGVVDIVGKGRLRNHGVVVEGKLVVVPAGNLRKVQG